MRLQNTKWQPIAIITALLVVVMASAIFINSTLYAAAKTWDGGGADNLFSTPENWSGDTIPVDGDSLIFNVTGLASDETLTNDLTGLSLVGITFNGNSAFDYTLEGNTLAVSGSVVEVTTDDRSANHKRPILDLNLTLSGATTFENIVVGFTRTLDVNGNALTLNGDEAATCGPNSIRSFVTGGGSINGGVGRTYITGDTSAFSGSVTLASTSTLNLNAGDLDLVSSITSNGGRLALQLRDADQTISTPMTLSGTLAVIGGVSSGCSGATPTADRTLTSTGSLNLNGNLTYIGYNNSDTNATGAYVANGFATTTDNSETGTISLSADSTPAAPTAPLSLAATPGNTQVALTWSAPSSNGTQPITDYVVEYKLAANPTWTVFTDGTSASTGATVTGLTNGSSYNFRVIAVNSVGQSPVSSTATSTPRTIAGAPTAASAVRGNGQATVSFTPPASNGGAAITGYTVTSSPGGFTGTGTSSPITVTGLTNGTAYTFTVTATNAAGTSAASTATSAVTPATVPGAPTGVSAVRGDSQATISFTAPASNGGSAVTGYTVTSSPGGFTASGSTSPLTVTGLTNGTAYTFTVTATNAVGTGAASAASTSVTPSTVPGAPTGVSATAGNGQASVSFTAPASNGGAAITSYTVTSSPGGFTGTGTSSPIVVSGLTNGTAYTFTVTATNTNGTGAASAASSSVTLPTVSGAPTGVSAVQGNTQATVSFTAPASNGGSAITGYTVTSSPSGITATGSSSPITITGLTNGTAYTFTVTATNAVGTGAASSASASVTPAGVPGAPTGVTATPGNGSASVAFTAPSNNGSAITSYTVTSSPGGFTGTGSASPVTVSGLTNGTAYTFTVTATNAVGAGTASSASASSTPGTVAGAPTGLSATPGNTQASLSWTAPASNGGAAISDYVVQYKLTSSGSWTTFADGASTATNAIVTGLTNNSSYDFQVLAVNSFGQSAPVTVSGVTPVPDPTVSSAPLNLIATPASTEVGLSWDAPASNGGSAITDYAIQYKLSSAGVWTTFADGTGTGRVTTVTGLTNGLDYDFRVAAVNGIGQSAYVSIANISPEEDPVAPEAPTQAGATTSPAGGIVIGWTAPSSDGGSPITDYLIEIAVSGTSSWQTVPHAPFTGESYEITTGLVNGTTYDIRISAVNAEGAGASVIIANYLYDDGSTSGEVVGVPNTGLEMLEKNGPLAAILFGLGSVAALLAVFLPRKRSSER